MSIDLNPLKNKKDYQVKDLLEDIFVLAHLVQKILIQLHNMHQYKNRCIFQIDIFVVKSQV